VFDGLCVSATARPAVTIINPTSPVRTSGLCDNRLSALYRPWLLPKLPTTIDDCPILDIIEYQFVLYFVPYTFT